MKRVKQEIHYQCQDLLIGKYLGQGIGIGVLDTGISHHPDFDRRILDFKDFIHGKTVLYDDCSHGTHVAGILAGSGKMSRGLYAGMAPRANLVIAKVLDQDGNGSIPQVIHGIQWFLNVQKKYNIRVVNISVGTQSTPNDSGAKCLIHAVERLWDAGICVFASAGNYGPGNGTIAVPGVSKKIITVGASDDNQYLPSGAHVRRKYSGLGPTLECVIKPDILAPGSNIYACNSHFSSAQTRGRRSPCYIAKSGTSMSTPIVCGAAALLLSKYPDMTNVETKLRIKATSDIIAPEQPFGKINVERFMEGDTHFHSQHIM